MWPQEPRYRVASWAVVLASPFQLSIDENQTHVVAAMPLGGITQTAYRGELFAVYAALSYAHQAKAGVRIWSDCLSVIRKFTLLTAGSKKLKANTAHVDLWTKILELVEAIGSSLVQLIKVPAHESLQSATTDFETWVFFHNNCVDQAAKMANTQRGDSFWAFWKQHAEATDLCLKSGVAVRDFLSMVAQGWVKRGKTVAPLVPEQTHSRVAKVPTMKWEARTPFLTGGKRFQKLFGDSFQQKILGWFNRFLETPGELCWISFYQLYIHYQLSFRDAGVVLNRGKWYIVANELLCFPEQFGFKKLAKGFRLMLQQLLKDSGVSVATTTTRPVSNWICCHVGSISLPCSSSLFCEVERWLGETLSHPAVGQGRVLDQLPLVGQGRALDQSP